MDRDFDTPAPVYIRFERSLPHQVRRMIAVSPIAYVPVGALEWHGEHAALGLDGIKAEWICEQAAMRTGGVLFPPMQWGAFNTMRYPFTFHFRRKALRRQVRATLAALADWGFASIVLLTGHYPLAQIRMVRRECHRISRRRGVGAVGVPEHAFAVDLGYLGDHAAKWETSILMAIAPDLVDLSKLPESTGTLWRRGVDHGILGICPKKEASAELGRMALKRIVDRVAQTAMRMVLEGEAPAREVYREFDAAFRHPIRAARTALGVRSKLEILSFFVGNALRSRHL